MEKEEWPREKLRARGAAALSDVELLAILFGSGIQAMPVLPMCIALMQKAENSLDNLSVMPLNELRMVRGIGPAKALVLIAAMELSERRLRQRVGSLVFSDHDAVNQLLAAYFKGKDYLIYLLVMLNANQEMLATKELRLGKNGLPAIKAVMICSLETGAAAIMICRNNFPLNDEQLNAEKGLVAALDEAMGTLNIRFHGLITPDVSIP